MCINCCKFCVSPIMLSDWYEWWRVGWWRRLVGISLKVLCWYCDGVLGCAWFCVRWVTGLGCAWFCVRWVTGWRWWWGTSEKGNYEKKKRKKKKPSIKLNICFYFCFYFTGILPLHLMSLCQLHFCNKNLWCYTAKCIYCLIYYR